MLSKNIIDFLQTKTGMDRFKSLTQNMDKANRYALKQTLLNPPKTHISRVQWEIKITEDYNEFIKSQKKD